MLIDAGNYFAHLEPALRKAQRSVIITAGISTRVSASGTMSASPELDDCCGHWSRNALTRKFVS